MITVNTYPVNYINYQVIQIDNISFKYFQPSVELAALAHLEVHNRDAVPVRPADDGVEVLKLGGQESSEGALQAHGTGLLEAQEVCSTNSSHVTSLRGVQGDEMELMRKTYKSML